MIVAELGRGVPAIVVGDDKVTPGQSKHRDTIGIGVLRSLAMDVGSVCHALLPTTPRAVHSADGPIANRGLPTRLA